MRSRAGSGADLSGGRRGIATRSRLTNAERARYRTVAALLKSASDPVRLQVMEAVSSSPRCIAELAAVTGRNEATIARHVAILRRAGFLTATKQGLHVYCRSACRESELMCRLVDRCVARRLRSPSRPVVDATREVCASVP